jgi:RNA polymerase sigma-70 factor (ECF subfamily)
MTEPSQSPRPGFQPTRWTIVSRARGDSPESKEALSDLCDAYWKPVFEFLRCEGRHEDESRELTQAFFARLLGGGGISTADPTKGRFRSYLLGSLKHFLAEKKRNEGRQKRGGKVRVDSLDEGGTDTSPGVQIADPEDTLAAKHFDREWAHTVMARSLTAVQARFEASGKEQHFNILKPWLVGETENLSQAEAAEALGLTLGAVKVAIHRLRGDFRKAVETEISHTLPRTGDLADEMRYLIEVLS